ncbi:MAG: hypothetical protein ABSE49_12930 [Polyangiaceae bacterium]
MSVKAQPALAVRDVRASATWYARILGSAESTGSPLGAQVIEEKLNPNAQYHELWPRDLDGYVVVLASPDGSTG